MHIPFFFRKVGDKDSTSLHGKEVCPRFFLEPYQTRTPIPLARGGGVGYVCSRAVNTTNRSKGARHITWFQGFPGRLFLVRNLNAEGHCLDPRDTDALLYWLRLIAYYADSENDRRKPHSAPQPIAM